MRTKRLASIAAAFAVAALSVGAAGAAGGSVTGAPVPSEEMVQECLQMHEQMGQMHEQMAQMHGQVGAGRMAGHANGQNIGHM